MRVGALLKDKLLFWRDRKQESLFPVLFERFQSILKRNNEILELMADMGDKLGGDYVFDSRYITSTCQKLSDEVYRLIYDLNMLTGQKYVDLYHAYERIQEQLEAELEGKRLLIDKDFVLFYDQITRDDLEDVGSKNANLGELKNVMELPVPDGFTLTTGAFHSFFVHNELEEFLERKSLEVQQNRKVLDTASREVRKRIIGGEVPPRVAKEVRSAIEKVRSATKDEVIYFAIRSSALEEDTEHSFAGLYESFLNVREDDLLEYYKKVLASAYSHVAWEYRLEKKFKEHEIAMGVGCQLMITPACSGVLYTMDPAFPERETMVVTATWGLGVPVVSGEAHADRYVLARDAPYPVKHMSIVHKEWRLVCSKGGGIEREHVPLDLQGKPCLNSKQLSELAHIGLVIERYYKRPQDIEWLIDDQGNMIILQTRPLQVRFPSGDQFCLLPQVTKDHPVILEGKGSVVQRGIAYGKVFVVERDEDLEEVPIGSILVAKHTSPKLTRVIRKVNAIITDIGSSTGHMATVAREFRIPTVVNTRVATRLLNTGDEVTVDATQNVIYEGVIRELCYYELTKEAVFEESYEYRLLRRILRKIAKLNLVDPHEADFRPQGCRTFHDIVRFVHEKAVDELIRIGERAEKWLRSGLKRLDVAVPLGLEVLDIGGGVRGESEGVRLTADDITSLPLRAFLKGLTETGLWGTEPVSVDLGSFMSSVTRTFSSSMASPNQVGRNLVVISREYMNMSLRLGYHFNIIDVYMGENVNDNYAYFRFLGGVTDITRRTRRAKFIADVLERHDFRIETRGDLVIGRLKKLPLGEMRKRVIVMGGLVAYGRQLDVLMKHDDHIEHFEEEFEEKIRGFLD